MDRAPARQETEKKGKGTGKVYACLAIARDALYDRAKPGNDAMLFELLWSGVPGVGKVAERRSCSEYKDVLLRSGTDVK